LRLSFENEGTNVVTRDQFNPLFRDDERVIESHFEVLKSRSLAKRVITILNLENHPDFVIANEADKSDPDRKKSILIDKFLRNLFISRLKKTDLINISFSSSDPLTARNVANAMAGEFMQFEIDCKNQSFAHIKFWLEKQLEQLGQKVEGSQRRLYESGEAGEILSPEDKDNVIIQRYIELSGLLTKAGADRIVKEALYHEVKANGAGATPITNNPLVMGIRQEIARESAKVESLQKIYLPDHPKLQAEKANLNGLQARLTKEIQNIRTSVETDYEAARRAENLIMEALEKQKLKISDLQKKLVQYKILKRDVETNEELYKGLLSRMKEASIASTMVPSSVAVIDPAERPLFPFEPRPIRNLALGTIFGLLGGIFLAFIVEYFDDSIKTVEEAEQVCQLPMLGIVPDFLDRKLAPETRVTNLGLITYYDQKCLIADSVQVVRTSVLLSAAGGPASIMVTSPNPLEGKTTIASNLAISFAMTGRRVVLVDGDLRRPFVHEIFDLELKPGLSELITGNVIYEEAIKPTPVPNLFIMTAGTIPPNPANLLGSKAFEDIIGRLHNEFQQIFIDSPPILGLPDSRILSSVVDSVIMVVRHNYTPRETARLSRQSLKQVNADMIGIILNQAAFHKRGYGGYYYYYKKYHHYYYSSNKEKDNPKLLS
jgi:capsular exopolysaccharide synthesis family protein